MIDWLWREKQKEIPLKVNKMDTSIIQESKVRLSVDLTIKHPISTDLMEIIKNADARLNLPNEVQVVSLNLTRMEIL